MVFPSWPMEQTDISLSTLVTLARRPPSSPPPSVLVSEDGCEAGPPGIWSHSRNTFLWSWTVSTGMRKGEDKQGGRVMLGWYNYWLNSILKSIVLFCLIKEPLAVYWLAFCFIKKNRRQGFSASARRSVVSTLHVGLSIYWLWKPQEPSCARLLL